MKRILLTCVFFLCLVSAAFSSGRTEEVPGFSYPYSIVTTTGMIGDVVRAVVGERANVHSLMGEDIDPHLYRPTRSDVARMQQADMIFYNGLMLEGRMGDTLVQVARTKPVYAVTERVEPTSLLDSEDYEESFDPHLWMDVSLWMNVVDVITDAVSEFDPAHADEYRARADEYLVELERLDEYVRGIVATIPDGQRVLITAHDAFGYFGAAYGLEVLGVQGISTESEAGIQDINNLVQFVVENRIGAVFAETTVPDRALGAVIEGARARGHDVVIGGELFSDAMGPGGTYEGTYIGMIDHNATTIVRGLGGTAPEAGMNGKLSR